MPIAFSTGKSRQTLTIRKGSIALIQARRPPRGAMITEDPLEHRRYDQSEYEPCWAAAERSICH